MHVHTPTPTEEIRGSEEGRARIEVVKHGHNTHTHIKGGLKEDHLSLKEDQRRITKGGLEEGKAHKDFVK